MLIIYDIHVKLHLETGECFTTHLFGIGGRLHHSYQNQPALSPINCKAEANILLRCPVIWCHHCHETRTVTLEDACDSKMFSCHLTKVSKIWLNFILLNPTSFN